MCSLESHAQRRCVIDELCTCGGLGSHAFLDPPHHGREHILAGVQTRERSRGVPDERRAGARATVTHAGDTEEAVKVVESR